MKEIEITIGGKKVHMAYCYSTEITYTDISDGARLPDFIDGALHEMQQERIPQDIKSCIFAISSGIAAYYASKNKDMPFKYEDIMAEITPTELATAVSQLVVLALQFYKLPKDGKKKEKKEKKEKNA